MMPFNLKSESQEDSDTQKLPSFWSMIAQNNEDAVFWGDSYLSEKEDSTDLQNVPHSPFLGQTQVDLGSLPELNWLSENTSYQAAANETEACSPAPSSVASSFSYSPGDSTEADVKDALSALGVSESELEKLSVKDLNRLLKLKGISKEEARVIKYRRRTLKNRGYAQNCRVKRISQRKSLEESNWELMEEINNLTTELNATRNERDMYRRKYQNLLDFVMAKRGKKPS